jgi:hypothetical protein
LKAVVEEEFSVKKIGILLFIFVITLSLVSCGDPSAHEGQAKTPSGSSVQKGRDFQEVEKEFKKKGFTNITFELLPDLIFGWKTKEREVEWVSVDGDRTYSSGDWYSNDVEVVIAYHVFPEKKTSDKEISNETITEESENTITTASDADSKYITVENNKEFADVVATTENINILHKLFVKKYYGKTLEFDGCVLDVFGYTTAGGTMSYTILLSYGDYIDDEDADYYLGPSFLLDNVSLYNLGIKNNKYLPEFIDNGKNVHIVARIYKCDEETGVIILKPNALMDGVTFTER